jgi:hypothetical protein
MHYYGSGISNGAVSPPQGSKTSYARSFYPYPCSVSFKDEHIFNKIIGRRVNEDMEDLTQKVNSSALLHSYMIAQIILHIWKYRLTRADNQ